MLSPEQSMNVRARITCHVCVVNCQAVIPAIRSPSISASVQVQLRKEVSRGWYAIFAHSTLSQIE